MFDSQHLKELERKAFRAAHQDGLWDIYIAGIVLSFAAFANYDDSDIFPLLRFGLFLFGLGLSYLIFWGGKKYLTTPRLGQVKFGPRRQKRKKVMMFVLGGIVLLQFLIVMGTVFLWQNPQWAARHGFASLAPDYERLLVSIIGAMFVGPSIVMIAYFNDFMRGYYIAIVMSLAVFSLIWFDQSIYMVIGALLILIPGVIMFIRFMRKYPLPPAEINHD